MIYLKGETQSPSSSFYALTYRLHDPRDAQFVLPVQDTDLVVGVGRHVLDQHATARGREGGDLSQRREAIPSTATATGAGGRGSTNAGKPISEGRETIAAGKEATLVKLATGKGAAVCFCGW